MFSQHVLSPELHKLMRLGCLKQAADSVFCAAAFQRDRRIRVYDVDRDWQLIKDVHCRNLRWTVTDTCLSPNQTFLLYASITPVVHMVRCSGSHCCFTSAPIHPSQFQIC